MTISIGTHTWTITAGDAHAFIVLLVIEAAFWVFTIRYFVRRHRVRKYGRPND